MPAHRAGFTTVLVGSAEEYPQVNYSIENINDLPNSFPQLWSGGGKSN
jgi:hypothetical protein